MKHILERYRLDSTSLHLALSYLAIIMVLSIGFSVIFYKTSTSNLNIQLHAPASVSPEEEDTQYPLAIIGTNGTQTMSNNISDLDAQLQKQVAAIRTDLVHQLIILNIGALVAGAVFSYYLSRRTLRPIEAAMDAQARFSSDASHELRTPLTALRARNEVALRKSRLTVAEAKEVIRTSIDQTIRLEKLADGLLRLTRGNDAKLAKAPVSLQEVTSEALNQIIKPAQAKDITMDDAVFDITVIGDQSSLVQAVVILLDNAVKYSDPGSTVRIIGRTKGGQGLLSIQDKGCGIRATDLAHIFERFYRADHSRTAHGYGLGLSIAKRLIDQLGGEITVKSTVGKGSTFTLQLPLAKP